MAEEPPARDAPKLDRLRRIRRVAYLRSMPGILVLVLLAVIPGPRSTLWLIVAACACVWLIGFVAINAQIWWAERESRTGPG